MRAFISCHLCQPSDGRVREAQRKQSLLLLSLLLELYKLQKYCYYGTPPPTRTPLWAADAQRSDAVTL